MVFKPEVSDLTLAYNKFEEDIDYLSRTPEGQPFSKETAAHIQDMFAQLDVLKEVYRWRGVPPSLERLKERVVNIQQGGKGIDEDEMRNLNKEAYEICAGYYVVPDNPLVQAIKSGDLKLAQSLFDKKQYYIGGKSFGTLYKLLRELFEKGDFEMLNLLIKNNVDVNIVIQYSNFPDLLCEMVDDTLKKTIQLLIDNKANFNEGSPRDEISFTDRLITKIVRSDDENLINALKLLFVNDKLNIEDIQKDEDVFLRLELNLKLLRLITYFGANPPEKYLFSKAMKETYEDAKKVRDEAIVEVLRKSDALPKEFQRDPFQIMLGLESRSMQGLDPKLREQALQICLDHDAKAKG